MLLIAIFLIGGVGCDANIFPSSDVASPSPASPNPSPQDSAVTSERQGGSRSWGGLNVEFTGVPLEQAERIIVLLHGYGAQGDDLVGLENDLEAGERAAFIYPAAPLVLESGGLAWTQFNGNGFESSYQQLLSFMNDLHNKYPDRPVTVGGFSQGAMMASNLLAEESLQIEGMLLYSPYLALARPPRTGASLPKVFLAHGRSDKVLAFSESEKMRQTLKSKGYDVTWFPFEGGHTISPSVIRASNKFLRKM
ncbi:MAG: alpha/beta hydrolase [Cyanobacteria bacterium P01_A01_bin.17]